MPTLADADEPSNTDEPMSHQTMAVKAEILQQFLNIPPELIQSNQKERSEQSDLILNGSNWLFVSRVLDCANYQCQSSCKRSKPTWDNDDVRFVGDSLVPDQWSSCSRWWWWWSPWSTCAARRSTSPSSGQQPWSPTDPPPAQTMLEMSWEGVVLLLCGLIGQLGESGLWVGPHQLESAATALCFHGQHATATSEPGQPPTSDSIIQPIDLFLPSLPITSFESFRECNYRKKKLVDQNRAKNGSQRAKMDHMGL